VEAKLFLLEAEQQKTIASTSILFGRYLRSKYTIKNFISINLLFIEAQQSKTFNAYLKSSKAFIEFGTFL